MEPWESPVRRRLRESLPVFGCTITTSSLDVAARAATAGFHFLWPLLLTGIVFLVNAIRRMQVEPSARETAKKFRWCPPLGGLLSVRLKPHTTDDGLRAQTWTPGQY
jgi:hypothetical protein